jgi:hypothetical protein
MLNAPRGIGKTLVALSIGLAVASGAPLLRWHAPRQRSVLYVDEEMPPVSPQERLRSISRGLGAVIPNDGFRILAAEHTENRLSISSEEGQRAIHPLLSDVDLVIFDNLSTLCTDGSESASGAWLPMVAVLLVHHAGTNGRPQGPHLRPVPPRRLPKSIPLYNGRKGDWYRPVASRRRWRRRQRLRLGR